MEYPNIEQFTQLPGAFEDGTEQGLMTRAIFLLVLGGLLRQEYEKSWEELAAYDENFPALPPMPDEALNFPAFDNLLRNTVEEFGLGFVPPGAPYWVHDGEWWDHRESWGPEEIGSLEQAMLKIAHDLFNDPNAAAAKRLVALGTFHPNQLVSVCSTISLLDVLRLDAWGIAYSGLSSFVLRSKFANVRDLAGRTLSVLNNLVTPGGSASSPEDQPSDGEPPSGPVPPSSPPSTSTVDSVLFHGTKPPSPPGNPAPIAQWWRPGQPFHNYLMNSHLSGLYDGAHPFEWEGGYRDDARAIASRNLYDWTQAHLTTPTIAIVAHSHGGNVAMGATHLTSGNTNLSGRPLDVAKLALLSTPIHWAAYHPRPGRVGEVVDVRVRHDAVIYLERIAVLLSGGTLPGQRIPRNAVSQGNPPICEYVIKGHIGVHSASYDENIWRSQGITI